MQTNTHRHILKKYFLFKENQLSENEIKQIKEHLAICKPCAVSWQDFNQVKVIEHPRIPQKVPETIWCQINTELDSRNNRTPSFTFFPALQRFVHISAILVFVVLAFSVGYFLTDFPQPSSSKDNLANYELQQQYFKSIHIESFSDFPNQTIPQVIKDIGVLEGLEEK